MIPQFTFVGVKDAQTTYHPFSTEDGLGLHLMRFKRKPSKDVILLSHGLTTSTDMFVMPEHENLVNFLHDNGFGDVWSLDWRGSMRHSYNLFPHRYTLDDVARYDIPAAIKTVRKEIGPDARIHAIVHCVGSITFFMSLLGGYTDGISSVITNSVSTVLNVHPWSRMKLRLAPFLIESVLRLPHVNPKAASLPGIAAGKFLAKTISLFHRECDVPECHMLSMMWGTGWPACYMHEKMDEETHKRVGDLFGATSLNYHRHIRKIVANGFLRPAQDGQRSLYRDGLSRLNMPILFMTGTENRIFLDSNVAAHEMLSKQTSDTNRAQRELFLAEGYGHQDTLMGKNVHKDVFPRFLEFLKRNTR